MTNLEKILKIRNNPEPVITQWKLDEYLLFGSLTWRDEHPILKLYFEFEGIPPQNEEELPFFKDTKPPLKVTMVGHSSKHGTLTIRNCMRFNWTCSHNHASQTTTYYIDFIPESIWLGTPYDQINNTVKNAIARDMRLGGFFGRPGLETIKPFGDEHKEVFSKLGNPEEIWAWSGPKHSEILLGNDYTFSVYTSAVSGSSATSGYSVQSTVDIHVQAKTPCTIEEMNDKFFQIEQVLSLYSLESFSFLSKEYSEGTHLSTALVWQLGENRDLFRPPMHHQILANFLDMQNIQIIFDDWFKANETVKLSRSLFSKSLEETKSGLARFISVAQAFEVLGREHGPEPEKSKSERKQQLKKFRELIDGKFDEEFVTRTNNLVSSSNRVSFKDVLEHLIGNAIEYYKLGKRDEIEIVCKEISDLRNTITHMSDNNDGKLNDAFSRVNKMSLKISFLYLLVQAHLAKLPLQPENIQMFLFNNSTARHGLDNEILERS